MFCSFNAVSKWRKLHVHNHQFHWLCFGLSFGRFFFNLYFISSSAWSSLWFSEVCTVTIVHRNHFFLYQQNKSSESKVKFRQDSNCCQRVLEAAKLAYAAKTKESLTSQKLGCRDFWRIANSVFNKGKSAIPPIQGPRGVVFCIW